jgi:hypothetical protein
MARREHGFLAVTGLLLLVLLFALAPAAADPEHAAAPGPGATVRGRVLDERGLPVAGTKLSLTPTMPGDLFVTDAETDAGGQFRFAERIQRGVWAVDVWGHGAGATARGFVPMLVEPECVTVGAQDTTLHVEVRTRRGLPIRGTITDTDGRPVREALVHPVAGGWLGISTESDDAGRFVLWPERDSPPSVKLGAPAGTHHDRQDATQEFGWGATDANLVVPRVPTHAAIVHVVEEETGKPVPDYQVQIHPDPYTTTGFWPSATCEHESGRVRLEGIRPGNHFVKIAGQPRWLLAPEPLPFTAGAGEPTLTVALRSAAPVTVLVVGPDGEPIAGAAVALLGRGPTPRHRHEFMDPRETEALLRDPDLRASCLDETRTDRAGTATLYCRPGEENLSVRAQADVLGGPRGQTDAVHARPRAGPWRVVIPAGARLAGTLRPPSVAASASICIRKPGEDRPSLLRRWAWPDDSPWSARTSDLFRIAADGSFEADGLPEGSWEVVVGQGGAFHEAALATVQLVAGETAIVDLDAGRLAPGRIRAKVLRDGTRPGPGELTLVGAVEPGSWYDRRVFLDRDGSFVAEDLPPATYRVLLRGEEVWGWSLAGSTGSCELGAGADADAVFHLESRRLHVRLRDAAGDPPPAGALCLIWGSGRPVMRLTDAEGSLSLDHAPGIVAIWYGPLLGNQRFLGEVLLDQPEQWIELALPPRKAPR